MNEEKQEEELPRYELVEIIDNCLCVITTLSELDSMISKDDAEDITALRKHSYKVIYAAQRKMLKQIKAES